MMHPKAHIAFMKENGISRAMLMAMPCKFPGIDPHCLRRLREDGIISRLKRDSNQTTTWQAGVYFPMIMEAWK
jgi:hypothetical protein